MLRKSILVALVLLMACASVSFAAQNVANNTQKGSLLVFPLVIADSSTNGETRMGLQVDTIIQISNDRSEDVMMKCYYMNIFKDRRDFTFNLTPKQTIWWSVGAGQGTIPVASFPRTHPQGELVCFAVTQDRSAQVSFNHLTGKATVVGYGLGAAVDYNAWAFTARGGTPGAPHGTPGRLELSGSDNGASYDACPLYNIANIYTAESVVGDLYGRRGVLQTIDNLVAVSNCQQDLRQDYIPHFTKLEMTVWNEDEQGFTGAWECADSVHHWALYNDTDQAYENFAYYTLYSNAAQVRIQGVQSNQCNTPLPTEDTGIVGIQVGLGFANEDLVATGKNTNGAGTFEGYVLWDPDTTGEPERRGRR